MLVLFIVKKLKELFKSWVLLEQEKHKNSLAQQNKFSCPRKDVLLPNKIEFLAQEKRCLWGGTETIDAERASA